MARSIEALGLVGLLQDFIDTKNLFEYGFNGFSICPVEAETEKGRYAGSVTIPAGFSPDSLAMTETENVYGEPVGKREK